MLRTLFGLTLLVSITNSVCADIKIKNIQARHGQFGPERASLDLYPGDEVVFTYMIEGVKADPAGVVSCEFELKVSDDIGKVVYENSSRASQVVPIGVDSIPNASHFGYGLGTKPGKYKVTVICKDNRQQISDSFERTVTCLPAAFAIIQPRFYYDAKGETSAALIDVLGQTIYFRLSVVNFDRSHQKIDLSMKMQLIDEKGSELLAKPVSGGLLVTDPKQIEQAQFAGFSGSFTCLKLGTFKVKIAVMDKVTQKAATFEAPIRVVANDLGR